MPAHDRILKHTHTQTHTHTHRHTHADTNTYVEDKVREVWEENYFLGEALKPLGLSGYGEGSPTLKAQESNPTLWYK